MSLLRVMCIVAGLFSLATLPFAFGAVMAAGSAWNAQGLARQVQLYALLGLALFPAIGVLFAIAAWSAGGRAGWWLLAGIPATAALLLTVVVVSDGFIRPVGEVDGSTIPAPADPLLLSDFPRDRPWLTALNLRDKGLEDIPPVVLGTERLVTLDLRGNRLTALPDALLEMPALATLRVAGNPIPEAELRRFARALAERGRGMAVLP